MEMRNKNTLFYAFVRHICIIRFIAFLQLYFVINLKTFKNNHQYMHFPKGIGTFNKSPTRSVSNFTAAFTAYLFSQTSIPIKKAEAAKFQTFFAASAF